MRGCKGRERLGEGGEKGNGEWHEIMEGESSEDKSGERKKMEMIIPFTIRGCE